MDPVQTVEGAGERSLENPEVKDGADYPVCFERLGMGDLEVVDAEEDTQRVLAPPPPPAVLPPLRPAAHPAPANFCCMESGAWISDSDEEEAKNVTHDVPVPSTSDAAGPSTLSKLTFTGVSWTSLPPDQVSTATSESSSVQDNDDDDDEEEEEALSRDAPTPDNTPEQTPSEELHHSKPHILEPGSKTDLASLMTEEPSGSKEAQSESGTTLSRVWSRILNFSSKKAGQQQKPQQQYKSDDDTDDDTEEGCQDLMSQRIEELEATLEEVRLDGDVDDPVVSYLVEEADEGARVQGKDRRLTVEEVVDDEMPQPPAPKVSGLLARIFTRSKTSHDIHAAPLTAPSAGKRAKTDKLHRILHNGEKKRSAKSKRADIVRAQPGTTVRHSLPRMLSRLLRHNESGLWGAEGDAGEGVVGGVSHSRRGPGPPPAAKALPRSCLPDEPPLDPLKVTSNESVYSKQQDTTKLLWVADFASQTEESCFLEYAPVQRRREHRGVLGVGACSTTGLAKPPDYIDLL